MKKVFILMLGLVASSASFAHSFTAQPTASQTRLVMTPEHKIKFFVQPLQTKGQLSIVDAKGETVYSETVALQKGLSQQFDITNLGIGTYQLTLNTGTEVVTKTFIVQADPDESFVVQES